MPTRRDLAAGMGAALTALALDLASLLQDVTAIALAMLVPLAVCLALPVLWWRRSAAADARDRAAATRDALTGLPDGEQLRRDLAALGGDDRRTLAIFDLVGFKKYNNAYGTECGNALLQRLARRFAEATSAQGVAYRVRGAQFAVLAADGGGRHPFSCDAGAAALFEIGEGFLIRCASGAVAIPKTATASEALGLAEQEAQAERTRLQHQGVDEAALAPSGVLAARATRSPYEVDALAGAVGRQLGLDPSTLDALLSAAALRDVGTMSIPDAIVDSPAALTPDDWHFFELHTLVGERLLRANHGMDDVAKLVRSSHERWDGTGYPDRLAGEAIPLASRIVFVCTAFQDMTAPRAHRPALTADAALAELRRCAGTQFDPHVVRTFAEAFSESTARSGEISSAR